MNLYAYVGNNPVNLSDPSGMCGWRHVTQIQIRFLGGSDKIDKKNVAEWDYFDDFDCPTEGGVETGSGVFEGTGQAHEAGHAGTSDANHVVVTGARFILASQNNAPPQLPPGWEYYPGSNNNYMYRRDDPRRRPHLTPQRQRKACEDYNRMMQSNTEIGRWSYGYGAGGVIFRTTFGAWLNLIVGGVNVLLGAGGRPEGC